MAEPRDPVVDDLPQDDAGLTLREAVAALRQHLTLLVLGPLAAGLIALGATYLVAPTFTAATILMPPQQSQSSAASMLASLGALGGLAAGGVGPATPADRYASLIQSATVFDRVIDAFKLIEAYGVDYRADARRKLASNSRISVGKKDGLITIEVDDASPQRAADIANRFVEELRRLTDTLAITEAQQRRLFFERKLAETREQLTQAQMALQRSGFSSGALKTELKASAEAYARLRAEAVAAEVRLQTLRGSMADSTPEVRQQQMTLNALREQLTRAERAADPSGDPNFIGKYRDFKYEEALFELYARQFELARADESREGALIQVVDPATPPELKSKPQRARIAVVVTVGALLLLSLFIVMRRHWPASVPTPR